MPISHDKILYLFTDILCLPLVIKHTITKVTQSILNIAHAVTSLITGYCWISGLDE